MTFSNFLFGHCTSPTFGAVTLDMVTLTNVQADIAPEDVLVGGVFKSLSGAQTIDRIALKRTWPIQVGAGLKSTWWPVLRQWKSWAGPWMFFDFTTPNLLTDVQRSLSTWTNAAGTALTVRADWFTNVAVSGTAQMGSATNSDRTLLVPVTAGTQYFAGLSVYGTGAWSVTVSVGWYAATGTAALSTSTVGTYTSASVVSSNAYLDGSLLSSRIGGAVTAPAGAVYAQLRVAVAGATVDMGDPVLEAGPTDPGNSMYVVNIDSMKETHNQIIVTSGSVAHLAGLDIALSEV